MKYLDKTMVIIIVIITIAMCEVVGLIYIGSRINAGTEEYSIDHYEGQIFRLSNELMGAYEQIDDLHEEIDSLSMVESNLPEITPRDRREMELDYMLSHTVVVLSIDSVEVCLQDPIFGGVRCKNAEVFHSDDLRTFYK